MKKLSVIFAAAFAAATLSAACATVAKPQTISAVQNTRAPDPDLKAKAVQFAIACEIGGKDLPPALAGWCVVYEKALAENSLRPLIEPLTDPAAAHNAVQSHAELTTRRTIGDFGGEPGTYPDGECAVIVPDVFSDDLVGKYGSSPPRTLGMAWMYTHPRVFTCTDLGGDHFYPTADDFRRKNGDKIAQPGPGLDIESFQIGGVHKISEIFGLADDVSNMMNEIKVSQAKMWLTVEKAVNEALQNRPVPGK